MHSFGYLILWLFMSLFVHCPFRLAVQVATQYMGIGIGLSVGLSDMLYAECHRHSSGRAIHRRT